MGTIFILIKLMRPNRDKGKLSHAFNLAFTPCRTGSTYTERKSEARQETSTPKYQKVSTHCKGTLDEAVDLAAWSIGNSKDLDQFTLSLVTVAKKSKTCRAPCSDGPASLKSNILSV